MSIKVLTWAFGLTVEPRAKIALLAIADNADDDGIAWPSRDLIAQKSSQSRATVNRRMAYLTELGVCSVHERFRDDGSQTTDEIRLNLALTSDEVMRRARTLKAAQKAGIEPEDADQTEDEPAAPEIVDRGCQLAAPPVQADMPGDSDVQPPGYHCGTPQNEPSVELAVADDARARDPLISKSGLDLAEQLLVIAGHDPKFWPPGWCGAPMRVQTWLANGWNPEIIVAATRGVMARKTGPPPHSVQFFEKAIAQEVARQNRPLPETNDAQITLPNHTIRQSRGNAFARIAARLDRSAG